MSNVWQTRYRLLLEELEALADWLSGENEPEQAALEEQLVRLLTGMLLSLRQHTVNKRGQCRVCGWTTQTWRVWRSRPRCTVYRNLSTAMSQRLEVVWWQLFESVDRQVSLDEVRKWLEQREQPDHTVERSRHGRAPDCPPHPENSPVSGSR